MSIPSQPLLQVSDLAKSFGALTAVDGVSFAIAPGEVVSIIGPNGSGKTTTINLLSGELRPDRGRIAIGETVITGRTPDAIARAGIRRTFQNGRVFGNATVEENVLVGQTPLVRASAPLARIRTLPVLRWIALIAETVLAIVGTPAQRREEADLQARVTTQLERFATRLTARRNDPAATLSYANRRRTEIARALASDPRLLLLDEPTAGMNVSETKEVMHQLLDLKAQGQTMVVVEHKLELVMTISDRVIVMDGGRIIAEGTPHEVQNDPAVIEAYLGSRRASVVARTHHIEDVIGSPVPSDPADDGQGGTR